jgi:hypothetical protein
MIMYYVVVLLKKLVRFLQIDGTHHILGDAAPCSTICGMGQSLTM